MVYTDSGEEVKADIIYGCVGFTPRTDCLHAHFFHALNERGEVQVNEHLQIKGLIRRI